MSSCNEATGIQWLKEREIRENGIENVGGLGQTWPFSQLTPCFFNFFYFCEQQFSTWLPRIRYEALVVSFGYLLVFSYYFLFFYFRARTAFLFVIQKVEPVFAFREMLLIGFN